VVEDERVCLPDHPPVYPFVLLRVEVEGPEHKVALFYTFFFFGVTGPVASPLEGLLNDLRVVSTVYMVQIRLLTASCQDITIFFLFIFCFLTSFLTVLSLLNQVRSGFRSLLISFSRKGYLFFIFFRLF
jgi:hypothetical protein